MAYSLCDKNQIRFTRRCPQRVPTLDNLDLGHLKVNVMLSYVSKMPWVPFY